MYPEYETRKNLLILLYIAAHNSSGLKLTCGGEKSGKRVTENPPTIIQLLFIIIANTLL
jgi:hypothetical protein